jgi:hypothetical protein
MTRRFDIGPLLVALGAVVLLVSLFVDWYGNQTAWDAFELADVLLAGLAVCSAVAALGLIAPELGYLDRRWIPGLVLAVAVLVTAEIVSPPPSVGGASPQPGAWVGFGAALAMLVGAVLSLGKVSFSVAVEGRQPRTRVAAVDHRDPTTETGSVVPRPDETGATEPLASETAAEPRKGRG